MKKINKFSDDEILRRLKSLVIEERKITLDILMYLREVERRRMYAAQAYSSMHEFCVKELGYSGGAAFRRIESMRLLKEVPHVATAILNGDLNLTVLSQVQTYVKHEKKKGLILSSETKNQILKDCHGKSTREVERKLLELAPGLAPRYTEKIQAISGDKTAIKIVADSELMELLEIVKNLRANPNECLADTLKVLAKDFISRKTNNLKMSGNDSRAASAPRKLNPARETRFTPKPIKLSVLSRANYQCEFIDRGTKRRCLSKKSLQIDHIVPFARGGATSIENLQVLCRAHNLSKAINDFGEKTMSRYLKVS